MTEKDILGFDPQALFDNSNEQKPQTQKNSLIYKTRPIDSKSEDGVYRATIKIVYNPFSPKESILEQQSYAIHDSQGWLTVVSSLTVNDTSCPIFKAWKKCHYASKEDNYNLWKQAAKKEEGGNALFDKRFARYCVVQIIEDNNQPDLVGKFMFWKLPKSIYDVIKAKTNPSVESKKAPIPVMDYLFGRAIELEVTPGPGSQNDERYTRETKYIGEITEDVVTCINPDGSPLLDDEEQEILDTYVKSIRKVWKERDPEVRAKMHEEIDNDENTKKLREFYNEKVLPQIKSWCPNLIEELGYKEWSPEVKERVNKWINIVLQGNDPAVTETPEVLDNEPAHTKDESGNTKTEVPASTNEANTTFTDASDDLPF